MYYPFVLYYPIQKSHFNNGLEFVNKNLKNNQLILMSADIKKVFNYYAFVEKPKYDRWIEEDLIRTDIPSLQSDFWYILATPNSRVSDEEREIYYSTLKDIEAMGCKGDKKLTYDDGACFYFNGDCLK